MRLFCKHNYNIIGNYTIRSQADLLSDKQEISAIGSDIYTRHLLTSKLVIVFKCSKCDRIKIKEFNNS